ncbi:proteoglycan 4b isoform X8 [Pseudorasbora parva]|uniref:proteoglycan 4b isoform X8 n=1 Tax=Pseudorasbora parva TaxID=51549 RepID=UPI00351E26BB
MATYLSLVLLFACASTSSSDPSSCGGRCGQGYYRGSSCQCDYECLGLNECCLDFRDLCTSNDSCKGRCGEPFNRGNPCHCDIDCVSYNQCCPDYENMCLTEDTALKPRNTATAAQRIAHLCLNIKNKKSTESSNEDMTNEEGIGEELMNPEDEIEPTPSMGLDASGMLPADENAIEPATLQPSEEVTTSSTQENASTAPTEGPTSVAPTEGPTSATPTESPITTALTEDPTSTAPTEGPTSTAQTEGPTEGPTSTAPTEGPTSTAPTEGPTEGPTSTAPTEGPTEGPTSTAPTEAPTEGPTSTAPTEGPTSTAPTEGPTEGLTSMAPTEGTTEGPTSTAPTEGPTSTAPTEGTTEGATSTAPTEGPTTTAPTEETTEGPTSTAPTEGTTEGATSTAPTEGTTEGPTSTAPTEGPTTTAPTEGTTEGPTSTAPTEGPTEGPTSTAPTEGPTTTAPTEGTTEGPTSTAPTEGPTSTAPTTGPASEVPTKYTVAEMTTMALGEDPKESSSLKDSRATSVPKTLSTPAPGKPTKKPTQPSTDKNGKTESIKDYQADDYDTNLCSGRPVNGLTTLRNGTVVVFRGHYFWTLDKDRNPDPPQLITRVWGIPSPIDTVYTRCNCQGKTYFFKGKDYWRFENGVMDTGFPKPISQGFGQIGHITAALSIPEYRSRKESVIFFRRGGMAQKYTYQVTPTCGKRPRIPVFTVRKRARRQAREALGQVINISKTWRGFPTMVTSSVSIPSRVKEGYKYYVFSQKKYYSIKMEREKPVILKPATGLKENSANSFFKCQETQKN